MSEAQHIVVIGAGIVGTATACYLRRDGHEVTLIDPEPPGTMTSFGNAGAISSHSCLPQTGPGLMFKAPRWLLAPMGPLFIRWRHLPEFLPWLIRFVRAGRPEPMRRQMDAMAALHRLALDAHKDLAAEAGTTGLIRENGTLTVYESARSFQAALRDREGQRERGFEVEELNGDELRQLEPGLAPIFPHVSEELWKRLERGSNGSEAGSVHLQEWPQADPEKAREDEITVVVQVNGRVRDKLSVAPNTAEDRLEELALASNNVKRWMNGKQVRKIVVVPDKLVNIVIG